MLRELPWSSNLHILSKTKMADEREFYLRMAIQHRWSVREVARQIDGALFERSVLREISPGEDCSHIENNNVHIICSFHRISPSVREYFLVRHVLTEEVSTDGRIRVNLKTSAKDDVTDKINRQKRCGQLVFGDYTASGGQI